MKTTLKSQVALWEIHAFAELAVWELRPDLQRLCSVVANGGELGPAVIDSVLPGLSGTAHKNIVRSLCHQRLLNDRNQLTPFGRACADTGRAPAWEMGVYSFLAGIHQLTGCCVLGFLRAESAQKDRDFNTLEPLPDWFTPDPDRVWRSVLAETEHFSVCALRPLRSADAFGRVRELDSGRLVWDIDLDTGRNAWRIEGTLGDGKAFRSLPGSAPEAGLTRLIERWEPRWSRAAQRAQMPYDGGVREGGHDDFLRTLTYPNVQVPGAGDFEKVVVEGVPVGPATGAAAHDWATALATARVAAADAHLTAAAWVNVWQDAIGGNPVELGAGQAPVPTAVVEVAGKPVACRTRWLLCAAVDLAME